MFQDFENIANPELIPQFEQWVKLQQDNEFQEGMELGEITEDDLSPIYKTDKITVDTSDDLPF